MCTTGVPVVSDGRWSCVSVGLTGFAAPRALSDRDRTHYLRAVERAPARDRALAYTEFYAGTRGGETVALDLGDLRVSARTGHLIIRSGKGGKYREVPLHPKLRTALDDWRAERAGWPGAATNPALFLNARGGRLSVRGAYDIVTGLAEKANLEVGRDADFTPHVLRHSAATAMKIGRVAFNASFCKSRDRAVAEVAA